MNNEITAEFDAVTSLSKLCIPVVFQFDYLTYNGDKENPLNGALWI